MLLSCSVKLSVPALVSTQVAPSLDTFLVTNSSYTNSVNYGLSFSISGTYSDYCLLENDTSLSNCSWVTGVIPSSYTVTSTENAKVLSLWVRNEYGTSSRMDSNSVTLDTTAPTRPTALALSSPASSPDSDTTPTLSVSSIEAQASVQLYSNNTCTTQVGTLSNAGAGGTVTITANALSSGTYTFYATQTDRASNVSPCSVSTVSYQLNAGTAVLTIAANTFTSTIVGASNSTTFTATNSGTGPATLATPTPRTLTTGTQYSITGGTCTASASIAVSGTCTIIVQFTPTSNGVKTDTINLAYNDGSANQSATRAITGIGLNPASLSLISTVNSLVPNIETGIVLVGAASDVRSLTVTNTGEVSATLVDRTITPATDHISYAATGAYPGISSGGCGATIAAGASCNIEVAFTPASLGRKSYAYNLSYNNGLTAQTSNTVYINGFGEKLRIVRSDPNDDLIQNFGDVTLERFPVQFVVYNPSDYASAIVVPSGDYSTDHPEYAAFTPPFGVCSSTLAAKSRCAVQRVEGLPISMFSSRVPYSVYADESSQLSARVRLEDFAYFEFGAVTAEIRVGGAASAGGFLGNGTINDPYQIQNVNDYINIDTLMPLDGWNGIYFKQTADISIVNIEAIGHTNGDSFRGIYDGGRYVIDSPLRNSRNPCYLGLFLKLEGTVRNVRVNLINIDDQTFNTTASCNVGLVADEVLPGGKIENSWVTGSFIQDPANNTAPTFGGVAGAVNQGTVENSLSFLQFSLNTGISCSVSTQYAPNAPQAGVVGIVQEGSSVKYSSFLGSIDFTNVAGSCGISLSGLTQANIVGGVIGLLSNSGASGELKYLHNAGEIVRTYDSATANGRASTGGVIGFIEDHLSTPFSEDSLSNFAPVSGLGNVGGIVGYVGSGEPSISNVYNFGNISGSDTVGGIFGAFRSGDLTEAINFGNVSAYTGFGGIVGWMQSSHVTKSQAYTKFHGSMSAVNLGCGAASVQGTTMGGIVGRISGSGSIENSFAMNSLSATSCFLDFGGIIGEASQSESISSVYSVTLDHDPAVGIPYWSGGYCLGANSWSPTSISNPNFAWDGHGAFSGIYRNRAPDAQNSSTDCIAIGDMTDENSFFGFDFGTVWTMLGGLWPSPTFQ